VLIAIIDNLARDAVAPATTLPRKAQSAAQNRGSHP
jgi:hypothetical protein